MGTIDHDKYEAVIGLEVHCQLLTDSKAFAPVSTEFGGMPNTQVTPLCLGHPGTLPVLNENLVRYTIKMGLATHCEIARKSIFARKNYFYPDLPKGYQISQYETPICHGGHITIADEEAAGDGNGAGDNGRNGGAGGSGNGPVPEKRIGITRIHMEEDAGKSIHDQDPYHTLVDLNRSGVPLIEIVSEPDIRTPREAYNYLTRIKQIVQYLEICDGNMEEGSLRCDANVSVMPRGSKTFGTRTELKNMNSFRNVERALQYEIERQIALLEEGGEVVQETLLWDADKMETRMMRTKEEAHDYRYFPEPDIPPVVVTDDMLEEVRAELPEMPDVRQKRFVSDFDMSAPDARTLTDDRYLADYFEELVEHSGSPRAASNLVLTEVLRVLNERSISIREFPLSAARLAGLITLREDDKVNSSAMTQIFDAMLDEEGSAEDLAESMNLLQVSDSSFIEPIVEQVIEEHPDEVSRYRDGKKGLIGFFIGQVMQRSQGKANPNLVRELIASKLEES